MFADACPATLFAIVLYFVMLADSAAAAIPTSCLLLVMLADAATFTFFACVLLFSV